mmetsp:Transcript_73775/g.207915  ORF Transcript_73775/g.207915 Transcript_73775/m.207915 type:complete len:239 (-) Transcript_73775:278-994(-)
MAQSSHQVFLRDLYVLLKANEKTGPSAAASSAATAAARAAQPQPRPASTGLLSESSSMVALGLPSFRPEPNRYSPFCHNWGPAAASSAICSGSWWSRQQLQGVCVESTQVCDKKKAPQSARSAGATESRASEPSICSAYGFNSIARTMLKAHTATKIAKPRSHHATEDLSKSPAAKTCQEAGRATAQLRHRIAGQSRPTPQSASVIKKMEATNATSVSTAVTQCCAEERNLAKPGSRK